MRLAHPILLLVVSSIVVPAEAGADDPTATERRTVVEAFVDRYYDAWARGDLDAYEALFHPKARAILQAPEGSSTLEREPFMARQRKARVSAGFVPPERIDAPIVRFARDMGYAVVRWRVGRGPEPAKTGWDHFALVSVEGEWRLITLTLHEAAPPAPQGP